MKRTALFLATFFAVQICLIFFHIYHGSMIMKLSYSKQKNEKSFKQMVEEKNKLIHELASLKSPTSIKAYAVSKGMIPFNLNTIKRLSSHENNNESGPGNETTF
jgi:cell division protein FtsL